MAVPGVRAPAGVVGRGCATAGPVPQPLAAPRG